MNAAGVALLLLLDMLLITAVALWCSSRNARKCTRRPNTGSDE